MTPFTFDPKRYPTTPGCYLMRNAAGRVLYVGKAVNLRRRLGSYFRAQARDRKARRLAPRVREVEVILVRNEVESLLLESNLIKHHKPPLNRQLVRDDTEYFRIALTGDDLPRLAPYRALRINKQLGRAPVARTFGPYVSRRFRDTLLDYVCETFGVRTCARLPRQVCLRYHLGRCCGVCEGHVSTREYAQIVRRATSFLSHPHDDLIAEMSVRMRACAERQQFESAARVRDQVQALESTLQCQVVDRTVDHDQAAIHVGRPAAEQVHTGQGSVLVADVRRGKVLGLSLHKLKAGQSPAAFLLAHFAQHAPPELIVRSLPRRAEVERALSLSNGHPVQITVPEEGSLCDLLGFCERNYVYRTTDDRRSTPHVPCGRRLTLDV